VHEHDCRGGIGHGSLSYPNDSDDDREPPSATLAGEGVESGFATGRKTLRPMLLF
jgi:hypothetical protein